MLIENFFHKFFKYKNSNIHKLTKYNSNQKYDLQNQIYIKIQEIDQKISENSKALLQAQIVKLRSTISQTTNFLERIGQNVYKQKIQESINWHQKQIKELYIQRKELQINLEKIKGIYWLNQIKRFLTLIFIGFFILLSLFIFFSGFIVIIYLLPLIILILIGYLITAKKDF